GRAPDLREAYVLRDALRRLRATHALTRGGAPPGTANRRVNGCSQEEAAASATRPVAREEADEALALGARERAARARPARARPRPRGDSLPRPRRRRRRLVARRRPNEHRRECRLRAPRCARRARGAAARTE